MIITERLMKAGDFTLRLHPDTPERVLKELREGIGWTRDTSAYGAKDAHIVVTKGRLPADIVTLSTGYYTGRLDTYEWTQNGPHTFTGPGLAAWLGAGGLPGPIKENAMTKTSSTLSTWMTDIFDRAGITEGTFTNTGTSWAGTWHWTTTIEILDAVCAAVGAEWRVNPDASIDTAAASTLFTSTPTVMVSDHPAGRSGAISGFRGRVTNYRIDSSELTNRVIVSRDNASTRAVNHGSTNAYGPDGAAIATSLKRLIDAPTETDNTAADNLAQATLDLYAYPRTSFGIDVESDHVRYELEPGDNLYVYAPPVVLDENETVVFFQGAATWPLTVRCQAMTYGVTGGGVYLVRDDGTAAVTDLTDYVVWSPPGARLEIGFGSGAGDPSRVLQGQARFQTAAVERLLR